MCDTSDRRKEDSRQNNKRCCNVSYDVTHITISDFRHANYIILFIITIHHVFYKNKIQIAASVVYYITSKHTINL